MEIYYTFAKEGILSTTARSFVDKATLETEPCRASRLRVGKDTQPGYASISTEMKSGSFLELCALLELPRVALKIQCPPVYLSYNHPGT
jgi:hypothetical protein